MRERERDTRKHKVERQPYDGPVIEVGKRGFHKESDVGQDLNRRQGGAEAKETPRCR